MIADWLRPIEQIFLAVRGADARVIGITSPHLGSGVSTLARTLAENYACAGIRTLLIDLTVPLSEATSHPTNWVPPGQPGPLEPIKRPTAGYDRLTCHATRETRFLYNNSELLRQSLDKELDQYAAVILDLPPLLTKKSDLLNGLAIAAACDAVCMVCITGGITYNELTTASEMLKTARVPLLGVVLNDVVPSRRAKSFKTDFSLADR